MRILIQDINQWFGTNEDLVQGTLELVYDTFSSMIGRRLTKDIIVGNHPEDEDTPIIYYYNEPCTTYNVNLGLKTFEQPQLIYQFAHELCHAYCNFNTNRRYKQKWFEETLCETASLCVLNQLIINFDQIAQSLKFGNLTKTGLIQYVSWRLNSITKNRKKEQIIPFLNKNIIKLEGNQYLRDENRVIALYLCEQLFYKNPNLWSILSTFNIKPFNPKIDFKDFLIIWKSNGDLKVQKILEAFE